MLPDILDEAVVANSLKDGYSTTELLYCTALVGISAYQEIYTSARTHADKIGFESREPFFFLSCFVSFSPCRFLRS